LSDNSVKVVFASLRIVFASLVRQYDNSLAASVQGSLPAFAQRHSLKGIEQGIELSCQESQR